MTAVASVVLLDDDAVVHRLVGRALRGLACDFEPFAVAEDCLARLERAPPDHLWVDMRMPGLDGIAFLALLRARCPRASPRLVLCSTVDVLPADRERAASLGADIALKDELFDPARLQRLLDDGS